MEKSISNINIGTFNAESFWRDSDFGRLPAISDYQDDAIVSTLDELLFIFTKSEDDILVTRYSMDESLCQYLRSLSINFTWYSLSSLKNNGDTGKVKQSIFNRNIFKEFCDLSPEDSNILNGKKRKKLSPYALLPGVHGFLDQWQIEGKIPAIKDVIKVNSKKFSTDIETEILGHKRGCIINSYMDYLEKGSVLLNDGPFLIKDFYGVSGKDNLLINTPFLFKRIGMHLSKLENKGMRIAFILELFLDKKLDFSCQFNITLDGRFKFLAIHYLYNHGVAFSGIERADESFIGFLEKEGYFQIIEKAAHHIYASGYWGEVCIDSMLLKSEEIIPILEINARKSMGFINHSIDMHLGSDSLMSRMQIYFVGVEQAVPYSQLINCLEETGLLYTKEKSWGIFPLSANTLNINWVLLQKKNQENYQGSEKKSYYKGRIYVSFIWDHALCNEQYDVMKTKWCEILNSLNIRIYNA